MFSPFESLALTLVPRYQGNFLVADRRRTGVAIRLQLFGFHAHVAKLSKVLIKGRDWYVLSHGGGGDQTVDKVSLRSLIAAQSVQVDGYLTDLDARTGDQAS